MEYWELIELKKCLILLSEEKDAKTGLPVKDTILKSTFNKGVLLEAADIIDRLLKLDLDPKRGDGRRKYTFFISPEKRNDIALSEEPISISGFAYLLNDQIDSKSMKKIKATEMTKWLAKMGYLRKVVHPDGRVFHNVTDAGVKIGITQEERESQSGRKYTVNLYTKSAQNFIVQHLDDIVTNAASLFDD